MGTHPNVILMLVLKTNDLPMKTYRSILEESGVKDKHDEINIGGVDYRHMVMQEDYDDGNQISADEGSIVLFDLATYGYGESISFTELLRRASELESWARLVCGKYGGTYEVRVGANYW